MNFACEQCHTDYSIEDARVAGKVLKVRCRTCQALITVKDPSLGAATPMASSDSDEHAVAGTEAMGPSASPAALPAAALPVPMPLAVSVPESLVETAQAQAMEARAADGFLSPAAAPARKDGRKWLVYALGGHVVVILLLGVPLAYLLTRRPSQPERAPTADPIKTAPPAVDDRPVVPVAPVQVPAPAPSAPAAPAPSAPVPKTSRAGQAQRRSEHAGAHSPALSSEQKELAALYGGTPEQVEPARLPAVQKTEQKHEEVSDAAIMATVTRNKKSVQACYERVLKHDESIRNLRVDVQLKVGVSGGVTSVSFGDGTIADGDLGRCLSQTIRHWHFPATDSEYRTAFPLLLQAQ